MIDEARFWKHCSLEDDSEDACWIWHGALSDNGAYGRYFHHGGELYAHQAAYELQTGHAVPPGHRLEQQCATPYCVRHWKLSGTVRKLTAAATAAIRASMMTNSELGRMYRVSRIRILQIRRASRTHLRDCN